MCFRSDGSGPDIWLTVEDGRYVPAPPIVYVSGLRQIQDRLHHRAYGARYQLSFGGGIVRLPISSTVGISVPTTIPDTTASPPEEPPAMLSTSVPPEIPTTTSTSPPATDPQASLSMAKDDELSSVAPESPKVPSEHKVGESPQPSPRPEPEIRPRNVNPPKAEMTGSGDCADSATSSNPSLSLSTATSSLHSILKKPSRSKANGTEPKDDSEIGKSDNEKTKEWQESSGNKKNRKTVSFAGDAAPLVSASKGRAGLQATAAKEGAAIGKKLAGKDSASQGLEKPQSSLGGGDGIVDQAHGLRSSRHSTDLAFSSTLRRPSVKQVKGSATPSSFSRAHNGNGGANCESTERAGEAASMLFEDGSNIDDEIPSK